MRLAIEHDWLPHEVAALDPAFVDELLLAETARADHDLFARDAHENADLRRQQAKRRAELVKWRQEHAR